MKDQDKEKFNREVDNFLDVAKQILIGRDLKVYLLHIDITPTNAPKVEPSFYKDFKKIIDKGVSILNKKGYSVLICMDGKSVFDVYMSKYPCYITAIEDLYKNSLRLSNRTVFVVIATLIGDNDWYINKKVDAGNSQISSTIQYHDCDFRDIMFSPDSDDDIE